MPLSRAEKEQKKVVDALEHIFTSMNVVNLTYFNQKYQDIFNASHFILYLTTADYITSVRCPDPDAETQNQMKVNPTLYEEWKSKQEKVEIESQ